MHSAFAFLNVSGKNLLKYRHSPGKMKDVNFTLQERPLFFSLFISIEHKTIQLYE